MGFLDQTHVPICHGCKTSRGYYAYRCKVCQTYWCDDCNRNFMICPNPDQSTDDFAGPYGCHEAMGRIPIMSDKEWSGEKGEFFRTKGYLF